MRGRRGGRRGSYLDMRLEKERLRLRPNRGLGSRVRRGHWLGPTPWTPTPAQAPYTAGAPCTPYTAGAPVGVRVCTPLPLLLVPEGPRQGLVELGGGVGGGGVVGVHGGGPGPWRLALVACRTLALAP